eukprot:g45764.t1
MFFLNQGSPSTVVDRALNRVQPISRTSVLTPSLPSRNSDRVPLVLTDHPTSIHIQKVIRRYSCHLQQDATTRHTFQSPRLSAFRRDCSLQDTLVHTSFNHNTPYSPAAPSPSPLTAIHPPNLIIINSFVQLLSSFFGLYPI